jgi:hypothetical protein
VRARLTRVRSIADRTPGGKGDVGDRLVLDEAAPALELGEALATGDAGHAQIVGHGDEEWAGVEVAGLGAGLHLEDRAARVLRVGRVAVVDDSLEHTEGADPHRAIVSG